MKEGIKMEERNKGNRVGRKEGRKKGRKEGRKERRKEYKKLSCSLVSDYTVSCQIFSSYQMLMSKSVRQGRGYR